MSNKEKKEQSGIGGKLLFLLYLLLVIRLLIFKYPVEELKAIVDSWEKGVILEGLESANFTLFKTIKMYIRYAYKLNSFENLVGNVAVFIPFGFFLPRISRWVNHWFMVLTSAFFFSLGIELFQLFSAFGAFDVDDLLLNSVGALIGYILYRIGSAITS